jgi:hypothetical protein
VSPAVQVQREGVDVQRVATAHEGESLGDARRVGHFREDRRMQRAPVVILVHGAWHGPWDRPHDVQAIIQETLAVVVVEAAS